MSATHPGGDETYSACVQKPCTDSVSIFRPTHNVCAVQGVLSWGLFSCESLLPLAASLCVVTRSLLFQHGTRCTHEHAPDRQFQSSQRLRLAPPHTPRDRAMETQQSPGPRDRARPH